MNDTVFHDSVEPAFYIGTHTFVNLLDINDPQKLKEKEAGFTALRSIELFQRVDLVPQTFDFSQLKNIHHHLFQDLYAWAGKPRSYDVKKGDDIFTPAAQLAQYEPQVFARSIEFSQHTTRPTLTETAMALASCLGIINIYHPFPEGNGRTQRIFISSLAQLFDYSINWHNVSAWEMVATLKQVHQGRYHALESLLHSVIIDIKDIEEAQ